MCYMCIVANICYHARSAIVSPLYFLNFEDRCLLLTQHVFKNGCENETLNMLEREKFMEAMADSAHGLDDTRLVSAALLAHTAGNTVNMDDALGNKPDIVSFNEY